VSARHQVKRPGSNFKKALALPEAGPAEETSFLRSVRILEVRNFTSRNSGRWDLVLTCSPTPSFSRSSLLPAFSFPQIPVVAASVRDLVRGRQAVARMVIGLRKAYGKPFVSYATNPHFTGAS
jgi:hypothetical protein